MRLTEFLDKGASLHPGDAPCLTMAGQTRTYADVQRLSWSVGRALARSGVRPGDKVAVLSGNDPVAFGCVFGISRAGAVWCPVNPRNEAAENRELLGLFDCRCLIFQGAFAPLVATIAPDLPQLSTLVCLDGADAGAPGARVAGAVGFGEWLDGVGDEPWQADPVDDVVIIAGTGGTTGKPKGAMLSHANLSAACSIYKAWFDPQRISEPGADKIICVLPLFHIFALTNVLLRGLQEGNELLLRARFDVATTLADIEVKRASVFPGVPTMWIALANTPDIDQRDLTSLRTVASGGAALPVEVAERFQKLTGQRLGGGWGMTETAPAGTAMPRDWTGKAGSVGLPLPGIMMDVVALDDPRRVLAPGTKGEIRIKGPNVTRGYWNAPAETAAAFVDGYLLTGDIGFMDDDGYFYLVDRKKDMIISGGFNVYPRTIEEAIYEHPAVAEAIVIGVSDAYRGEAAKAFVQLKAGAVSFSLEELRAFLADKIGRHEMPAHLEFRDALPKTAVGKLSKRELVDEERRKTRAAAE